MKSIDTIENKKPTKNCKKSLNKLKKHKTTHKTTNNQNTKPKIASYIKALLKIKRNLPNIINILDKLIERKASMLFPSTSIQTSNFNQTYNQVEKVISLTERKDKLLNLNIISEKILECLSPADKKLLILKYTHRNKISEISKEINITERSVYRKINSAINKISEYMLNKNWTISFLDNQIGEESWIIDIIEEVENEDIVNKTKHYNKSSSSITS